MTKIKRQLREEAVERLKNCVAARFDAESIVIALTSGRHGQSDWSLECDKLIYLLTEDANDDSAPEKVVSGESADVTTEERTKAEHDGLEPHSNLLEPDSREKLEEDVRKHYAYSTTTLMYPPSANKTTDMLSALPVDTVIGWLDRQAAITERETKLRWEGVFGMSKEYDDYLKNHIDAVRNAVGWMVKNNVGDVRNLRRGLVAARLVSNARAHDESKFLIEEYGPYDAYFYGERDEGAFDVAWLHHIHVNPHHWQHWLLFEDENDGRPKPLEMPKEHALEMIADWWSFSWRSGNLREVFRWYDEHKDRIILHPGTRKYVESVLAEIQQKLDAHSERLCGEGE